MMKLRLLLMISLCAGCSIWAQAGRSSQIVGSVQAEDGKAVPDVWVTAMLDPRSSGKEIPPDFKPVNVHTQPDGNGAFRLEGLPNGEYILCAQVVSNDLINGCQWGITQRVTVPQSADKLTLVLQKGQRVKIVVNDPKSLREKVQRKPEEIPSSEPDVKFDISADGGVFTQFAPARHEGKVTEYEALVPFNTPIRVHVNSKVFSIEDEDSKQLLKADGQTKPVTAARGGVETIYRLSLDSIKSEAGK